MTVLSTYHVHCSRVESEELHKLNKQMLRTGSPEIIHINSIKCAEFGSDAHIPNISSVVVMVNLIKAQMKD